MQPQVSKKPNRPAFDEDRFKNKQSIQVHASSPYAIKTAYISRNLENQMGLLSKSYARGEINSIQLHEAERRIGQVVDSLEREIKTALQVARPRNRQNRPQQTRPNVPQAKKHAGTAGPKPAGTGTAQPAAPVVSPQPASETAPTTVDTKEKTVRTGKKKVAAADTAVTA
jgi:hypothetical protein